MIYVVSSPDAVKRVKAGDEPALKVAAIFPLLVDEDLQPQIGYDRRDPFVMTAENHYDRADTRFDGNPALTPD